MENKISIWEKIFRVVSWLTILSAFILVILVGYWLIFPVKPAEFNNVPFPILNKDKTVKRGECLFYEIDYCKFTDDVPQLTRFFVDGFIFETPHTVGVATKGCRKQVATVFVPDNIMPGTYYIKTIAHYQVNPLRAVDITNRTEEFVVE